ncbi:MAG: DUF4058 family protein [Planctomycetota bacterium]|nr:DUF4058 family protein [Planctomycetaceae bacterium]MDQ3330770.1 DUF4058 family protein [Planctomycetota bacterium]
MPSPFPGMDPYLEDPAIRPDFHHQFAGEISAILNGILPARYYAQTEMRTEVGIVGDDGYERRIIPDVTIQRRPSSMAPAATAVLAEPRQERSASILFGVPDEPLRHHNVEIRDAARGHALVTLLGIVSPSNKRPGPDRKAYLAKQREVLESDAGLVEIDLLASGETVVGVPSLVEPLERANERKRYLVTVSRAWKRHPEAEYEAFSFGLDEPLPCIGIPLREGETETLLDLQYAFNHTYDRGPYRRGAVDYDDPPEAPLTDDERQWVRERVGAAFPSRQENPS